MVFLFLFLMIILLLIFSKIRIEIINFKFSSITVRHINQDYKIIIKLYVLSKIPILKVNITKTKLEKLKLKEKIRKIDFKALQNKNSFDKRIFKAMKKANIAIQDIHLKIQLGTENAALTSMIVPVLSTIIAIILRKKVKEASNQSFKITPVYSNQNLINIGISSIFEIKMIHIISIIYILNQKEGVKKYERTSNRRSYDYSYE
ncbi:MAG: DUF2953 domain-containing protein [Clostridia bacterium]|nr:DUF2953 domain-containing protein [Clostridia bacterium]